MDSVSLISIAARALGQPVHGFTIANSDARYEEQAMVDTVVAELGVDHTSVALDPTHFLERLRAQVRQHDSPISTISYYVHNRLMASIHEHGYRVSVSGTAADEVFSGYYDHHLAYLRQVHEDGALYEPALAAWSAHVRPVVRNPFLSDPDLFVRDPGSAATSTSTQTTSPRSSPPTASPRASPRSTGPTTCCATGCSTSSSPRRCP